MKITPCTIPDVLLIESDRYYDPRGYFTETYRYDILKKNGFDSQFIQDNMSSSISKYTLRGLHYQLPPYDQAKLVRVIHGTIADVAVDIRVGSPTFGNYVCEILSCINNMSLLIPSGFAHGFITLEDNTSVMYKTSNYYNKQSERSILWSDPIINIPWDLLKVGNVILSDKDKVAPLLKDIKFEDIPTYL